MRPILISKPLEENRKCAVFFDRHGVTGPVGFRPTKPENSFSCASRNTQQRLVAWFCGETLLAASPPLAGRTCLIVFFFFYAFSLVVNGLSRFNHTSRHTDKLYNGRNSSEFRVAAKKFLNLFHDVPHLLALTAHEARNLGLAEKIFSFFRSVLLLQGSPRSRHAKQAIPSSIRCAETLAIPKKHYTQKSNVTSNATLLVARDGTGWT